TNQNGLYAPAASELAITLNGTKRLHALFGTGAVLGLNTTPTQWGNLIAYDALEVGANNALANNSTQSYWMHNVKVDSSGNFVARNSGVTAAYMLASGGQFNFYGATAAVNAGLQPTFNNPLMVDGNANLVSLLCGQLKFPATQNASSDANTLDDYEEGTFTPTVTSQAGSITSYTASGRYTKVGRFILCQINVLLSNIGTATGYMTIAGLPFNNGSGQGAAGTAFEVNNSGITGTLYLGPSTNSGNLFAYNGSGGTVFNNNNSWHISIAYQV
ncbi:MAG TPA: hypothetical protein VFM18_03790, partial [Methanosarcina sp.]|nr:hypothetical protein [Methanosarcina sp.]